MKLDWTLGIVLLALTAAAKADEVPDAPTQQQAVAPVPVPSAAPMTPASPLPAPQGQSAPPSAPSPILPSDAANVRQLCDWVFTAPSVMLEQKTSVGMYCQDFIRRLGSVKP